METSGKGVGLSKRAVLLCALALCTRANLQGQGTVNFSNVGDPITNCLIGQPIVAGTTFSVALYYGPDGTPDDSSLIQIGASGGFIGPGVFALGTRTTPATTPPGEFAMFQVRVWESAFGSAYEEAINNSNLIGGRLALTGKSALLRAQTGDSGVLPPGSLRRAGLRGFYAGLDPLNPNCPVSPPCCISESSALDTNFNPRIRFRPDAFELAAVTAVAVQSDGKILIGGGFDQVNDTDRLNIARLNQDGTTDPSFDPGTQVLSIPRQIIVQPNGKILVNLGSTVWRLRADGAPDAFLSPYVYTGASSRGEIYAMALAPDGKIIIAGHFNRVSTTPANAMARLLPFGLPDASFVPAIGFHPDFSAFGEVADIAVQPDGKILAAGFAYATNGPSFRSWSVFRLLDSGDADTSFYFGGFLSRIMTLALLPDGNILVGDSANLLFRLDSHGSSDPTYHPAVPMFSSIYRGSIQPQSNGKVLLALGNTAPLLRLNPDDSRDITFTPIIGGPVFSQAVQPGGKILIGGAFTAVNGANRTGLARLIGAAPCRFQSITRLPSGEVQMTLVGETYQPYALQTSSDLAQWVALATNSSPSGVFSFSDSAPSNSAQRFYRAVFLP